MLIDLFIKFSVSVRLRKFSLSKGKLGYLGYEKPWVHQRYVESTVLGESITKNFSLNYISLFEPSANLKSLGFVPIGLITKFNQNYGKFGGL